MTRDPNHRIAAAIAVKWTPGLSARVERRIEQRIAMRRRRRRLSMATLALMGMASAGFAFTYRWTRHAAGRVAAAPSAARVETPPRLPTSPPAAATAAATSSVSATPARRTPPARSVASAAHATRPETVEALFAAADAARLAARPVDAVAPLTAIFIRHAGDPRAAIAAYQLGRVWALDLHDPARAAAAFARAHDLDPGGALAADAAAHAAEARRTATGAAR